MTSTLPTIASLPWADAIRQPAIEFPPTPLPLLAGVLPPNLRGSLYRNGPATLKRGGEPVGHWFDGDGGILAVHFTAAGATATYRYVQTTSYHAEVQAGQYLYGSYDQLPKGNVWQRWQRSIKNVANTSVLALPDRLLALWEGGPPYALTLDTLETIGLNPLAGLKNLPFSAHPKVDAQTGEIFNFGVALGAQAQLHLYRSDRRGQILRHERVSLPGFPLLHDFVLAGRYLVFYLAPVRIQLLPVLLQQKTFSQAAQWLPELGGELLICDRDSLQLVQRLPTDSWFHWHWGNGYELPDGTVVLHYARYEDFQTNQRLKEVATGAIHTAAWATLWELRIDPLAGKILSQTCVLDRSCEFPVVSPHQVGQPHRYTYLNIHRGQTDPNLTILDGLACFDHQTGTLTTAPMSQFCYPSEPMYAPDPTQPDRGWILSVIYDGDRQVSECWIFASDRLDQEPVCRLGLPHVIPIGFHGTWQSA